MSRRHDNPQPVDVQRPARGQLIEHRAEARPERLRPFEEEAERILWDISWIWGPPEEHLALLLRTVGINRFTFGTGMPMRLPETSVCKLDLLDLSAEQREAVESGNLKAFSDLTI